LKKEKQSTKNKLYLVRCPECGKENYAMAVSSGYCAWCGYKAVEEDVVDGRKGEVFLAEGEDL
jgi:ribosomal protein L37E